MKEFVKKIGLVLGFVSFAGSALADPPVANPTPNPGPISKGGGNPPLSGGLTDLVPNLSPDLHLGALVRCALISPTITYIDHIAGQKVEVRVPNPLYTECINRYR